MVDVGVWIEKTHSAWIKTIRKYTIESSLVSRFGRN